MKNLDWDADKRAHERRIFEGCCQAARWSIVRGSLKQPQPPAPDIEVVLAHSGAVYFELVRLDADTELKSLNHLRFANDFFQAEFRRIAPPLLEALSAKYANAEITIEFEVNATVTRRKLSLRKLWSVLDHLSIGTTGSLHKERLGIPSDIASVWVIRTDRKDGPHFRSFQAGRPTPVPTTRIVEKLQKPYCCSAPLELIAYKEIGNLAYAEDLRMLHETIVQHLPTSNFRNVWVYELVTQDVFGFPNARSQRRTDSGQLNSSRT